MINTLKDHTSISVISENEGSAWSDVVFSLRDHWIEKVIPFPGLPVKFWSLGHATYLHGKHSHTLAKLESNPVLMRSFSRLYDLVIEKLSEKLDMPVKIDEEYSLPGFHIHTGNSKIPTGVAFGGTIHKDAQHQVSNFPFAFTKNISFTLALRLPANGGGINFWPEAPEGLLTSNYYANLSKAAQDWVNANVLHHEYTVGKMVMHSGDILHQLANNVKTDDSDFRITLQGHGVLREDGWLIFF